MNWRHWRLRTVLVAGLGPALFLPASLSAWHRHGQRREDLLLELGKYHQQVVEILALGMQEPLWSFTETFGEPLLKSVFADKRIACYSPFEMRNSLLV